MQRYGGTWDQYLDTPQGVREMLLHLDAIDAELSQPAPLGATDYTPMIS